MRKVTTKYYFILLLFLSSITNSLTAQQYNFKNYTTKNGLAGSSVNSIFQDSRGYVWFGTQGGGVSRFNGRTFKNFNKESGLIDNDVTYITEDKSGNIWIATSNGVSQFDGVKFTNYSEKEGLAKGVVYCIYVDDKNSVWFAVQGAGVYIYNSKKFTALTFKDGLPSNNVYSICRDKKGNYWFSTENGIAQYDGHKVAKCKQVEIISKKTVFSSCVDSKGIIWFGTTGDGVIKYAGKTFERLILPELVGSDFIGGIAEDQKGNIWFATDHGALKYGNKQFHLFDEKQGLSANAIYSLCCDYEGNMWIGTGGGGVNKFNNESFVNYTDKDGLTSKNNNAIYQLDAENYIIGTSGAGLNLYNSKTNTFQASIGIDEIDHSKIYCVMADNNQNIWIGAQEGVFVLQRNKDAYKIIKRYISVDGVQLTSASKIIQDKKNNIWIASYGSGVFKINGDNVENLNKKKGFVSNNIITVFEDSKSNIWIGTIDAGAVKYDGTKYINYAEKEGLMDKAIWSITEDDAGTIYFGTGESGLIWYDGKHFKAMSKNDGLCSSYISSLMYDEISNCLWLGTDRGINKLTFRENFAIASLRLYGEEEGYKGDEVNQNSIMLDKDGTVWFCTINGLSRYNREYDSPNVTPPKLNLTGIRLAYQTVDWNNYADSVDAETGLPLNLVLSHKNNNLSFDFQAFTTDNVKYTFMLEGQDEVWSPLSTNVEAVFTNISPGKTYTFKVKAINSSGIWSKDVVAFTFVINAPWWQTWWFYTLSILIVATSIYGFVNYRTAQLAKEKRLLEEKVTERTVELKGANDKLSVAFQDIKDSINYAKKIQDAILPLDAEIKKALPQSFVLFKPRDVVSGDFYWFNKKDDCVYFAAVDCTGHGVPGAFMSMIGSSLLNEIISKKGALDAASILKKLHIAVRKSLKQDRDSYESKDGMDLALAVVNLTTNTLQYAGAKRPLFFFNNETFEEIKADKQSIGGIEMQEDYHFTNHDYQIKKGDTFYMFTDGYVDQFGGEKGKKYSTKRLKESLQQIQLLSLKDQEVALETAIDEWKSEVEQVDDILVIGIRF